MKSPLKWIGEVLTMNFDVSRGAWFGPSMSALRSMFADAFFQKKPMMYGSGVNYDLARSLYRNDADKWVFGAGFVKPIIDLAVEYIGIPSANGTSDDAFLNECMVDHWAPSIQQIITASLRDSKVYIRYRQPRLDNPLMTEADRMHGRLEVLMPEECDLTFDPSDPELVYRCAVTHFVEMDERTGEDIARGIAPRLVTHEIIEVITQDEYTFFDKTAGMNLAEWTIPNEWHFVPVWPAYNEYAPDLGGGQSDIESVLPFIQAFHDVFEQALTAHKYHSMPKVKFKIKDVSSFIRNNWPDAIDPVTGGIKQGAKISFSGREVMFFNVDEDGGFIEAKSVLGDSLTLLEFLIDCICVASETPRWALFKEEKPTAENDATVQPFVKKIDRKRIQQGTWLSMVCKMALASTGKVPTTPRFAWTPVRLIDLVSKGQAIQQLVMALDVATQHQWVSDRTVVRIMSSLFDEIADPDQEMSDAKDNIVPAIPAPAPASDTQGAQTTNGNNGNGVTDPAKAKAMMKKLLTTTAASKS